MNIPLFPLQTVLFPGGVLPLRIFEPRYLDMVSECLREEAPFGICLIEEGREVGAAATVREVGTLARISWFEQREDGLLGITVDGRERFRICSQAVQPDQLLRAEVRLLPAETARRVPEKYQTLSGLLEEIFNQLGQPYARLVRQYDDAAWVSARLAEFLPLPLPIKQALLEMDDVLLRLEHLQQAIERSDFV